MNEIVLLIVIALLFLNHIIEDYIGHDAIVIDACIAIGYILFVFL